MEANHIKLQQKDKKPNVKHIASKPGLHCPNMNNQVLHKEEIWHPSWEAKQRQKEALDASLSLGASGKKIVFGDDSKVVTGVIKQSARGDVRKK